jgi:sulfoxide reductase catalytic subunit YedY
MVEVDLATWNLEIGGLVSEPRSYRFSELLDGFPKITQNRRWVTVMGWTTRAAWDGVLLQHLVDKARPSSEVQWIRQEDLLGHVEYLPFRETLHQRALLAYGVGGQRLPTLYGGPLMTMVFHRYSYKGLGQLRRLDLVAEPGQNYSQGAFGWDPHGEIQPSTAYAWDLKTKKPLRHAGEITDY